ncbi:response regulator [Inquilinus sp. CAU 1745]|uniref:response regulator n=1 Tax=Inquilinus sp. CAU 1745 TaxID=3140369 RepID=UPI00325BFEE7
MAEGRAVRVLIVEDEFLVAMHLEALLGEMGYQVIGPATRIGEAIGLAREKDIDFAVLDINLAGTKTFPVADILRQRGVPFMFASGYGSEGLIDGYRDEGVLQKPYDIAQIRDALARIS